jgi:hypothetical protein
MIFYSQLGILFLVIDSSLARSKILKLQPSIFYLPTEIAYFESTDSLFAVGDSLFAVVCRQGFYIGYDGFMERLDHGHLHLLLE